MAKEPEVREFVVSLKDIEERMLKAVEDGNPLKHIATQQELFSDDSKKALQLGIDLPKYKAALKEQVDVWRIGDKLANTHHEIYIHWSVAPMVENWFRAEFPGTRFRTWQWGNWWNVRFTRYNHEKLQTETTEVSLVIG